jgi:hypothetical protein
MLLGDGKEKHFPRKSAKISGQSEMIAEPNRLAIGCLRGY